MARFLHAVGRASLIVGLLLVVARPPTASGQPRSRVDVLKVQGAIDPWTVSYLGRGLDAAEAGGAEAVIILLDTPGGELKAMQEATSRLMSARVPVIVFVYPPGAWAASAGTFLVMAANIAAMAPGTAIGAAHPVDASGADIASDERQKATNMAASLIESLARERGHNAEWAARAVRESASATAQEAVEQDIVDLLATDVDDLLAQIDGRVVRTAAGEVTLHTRQAGRDDVDMNLAERLLHTLVDPNIALILLQLGLLAIVVEIYNPGAIAPVVIGVISVLLALVALGNLPINGGGLLLIVVAMVLFVLDIKINSIAITIGSIVSFVAGALMLFSQTSLPSPYMPAIRLSPFVVGGLASVTLALLVIMARGVLRAHSYPVLSGTEALIGAVGSAVSNLDPAGQVQVRGELWSAQAQSAAIRQGAAVQVVGIEGLRLKVVEHGREES